MGGIVTEEPVNPDVKGDDCIMVISTIKTERQAKQMQFNDAHPWKVGDPYIRFIVDKSWN